MDECVGYFYDKRVKNVQKRALVPLDRRQSNPRDDHTAEKKMCAYRSKLRKDMQGLMGEANMKFAHGQSDEAIKMCMEVIRQVPNAKFLTLPEFKFAGNGHGVQPTPEIR